MFKLEYSQEMLAFQPTHALPAAAMGLAKAPEDIAQRDKTARMQGASPYKEHRQEAGPIAPLMCAARYRQAAAVAAWAAQVQLPGAIVVPASPRAEQVANYIQFQENQSVSVHSQMARTVRRSETMLGIHALQTLLLETHPFLLVSAVIAVVRLPAQPQVARVEGAVPGRNAIKQQGNVTQVLKRVIASQRA